MPSVEQISQPSLGVVGLVLCCQDGRARPVDQQRAQMRPRVYSSRAALACRRWSFGVGTRPSQAETCRPLSKLCASAIDATRALAASGPMPGIFSSLRLSSLLRCQAIISRSNSLTCRSSSFRCWFRRSIRCRSHRQAVAGILEDLGHAFGHVDDALGTMSPNSPSRPRI